MKRVFFVRRDASHAGPSEVLSGYIDGVLSGAPVTGEGLDLSLQRMVHALRRELRLANPDPEYVDALRLRLLAAADQRAPLEAAVVWRQPAFIIGAASLVSAAAVIAYVARSRAVARAA